VRRGFRYGVEVARGVEGADSTVTVAWAELPKPRLSWAVFVMYSCAVGVTTTVTVPDWPLERLPRKQNTKPVGKREESSEVKHLPWLGVTDTSVTPTGTRSVTTTGRVRLGLLLVSTMVKVSGCPTVAVSGLAVLASTKPASCVSVGPASPRKRRRRKRIAIRKNKALVRHPLESTLSLPP
jgi:hypothetical protein